MPTLGESCSALWLHELSVRHSNMRFAMEGHMSTVRCLKVLDGRPIAISGSRDTTIRIWDISTGRQLRVLEGHENSVRCLEVSGNKLVSGSYDNTCRVSVATSNGTLIDVRSFSCGTLTLATASMSLAATCTRSTPLPSMGSASLLARSIRPSESGPLRPGQSAVHLLPP
jgi:WD40 repeat protein